MIGYVEDLCIIKKQTRQKKKTKTKTKTKSSLKLRLLPMDQL